MKSLLSLLLFIALGITASAQSGKSDPQRQTKSAPGRILVKLSPAHPAVADRALLLSTAPARLFGVSKVRPWLTPELVARPVEDRRNGVPSGSPVDDEQLKGLARIVELQFSADVDPARVASAFASMPEIEYAEPVYLPRLLFTPNDQYLDQQWYLDLIHAKEGWDIQRGDSALVVAIVDTGIEKLHDDLRDAIWTNPGETGNGPDGDRRTNGVDDDNNGLVDDWWGYDFGGVDGYTPDNNPSPGNEPHGTHVAGTVGATGNNAIGVAGIAFGCRLMAVKASDDRRNPDLPGGFEGILYAARMGADVINCSWGGDGFSRAQQEVIDAVRGSYGVIVVAAGGNDGEENDIYPAGYRGVISVGAVTEGDSKAAFSNYGRGITIAAPGTSIYSTGTGNLYFYEGGTSQAAPIVSGTLGLVMRRFPALSMEQVVEVVRATSDDISAPLGEMYGSKLGTGRINLQRALSVGPSIASARVVGHRVTDGNGDGVFEPGEQITVHADGPPMLAPASLVTATIPPLAPEPVAIARPVATLGAMAPGATVTTDPADFLITMPEGSSQTDRTLEFRIAVTTEGRTNDYYFTITLLPTYLTTAHNEIGATFNSVGNIGYNGLQRDQGDGFTYGPSKSYLYHGGLLVGTDSNHFSDVVRIGRLSEGTADGFRMIAPYRLSLISNGRIEMGSARFSDLHRAPGEQVGVTVDMRTYERHDSATDNILLAVYRITNSTGATLENLHAGLYLDWDVGEAGENDQAAYDSEGDLGYVTNEDPASPVVGALLVSGGRLNFRGLDNYDSQYDLTYGFSPAEKWSLLSGGLQAAPSPTSDVSMMIGSGPTRLAPGETGIVAYALVAAPTLDSLRATAARARAFYTEVEGTLSVVAPIHLEAHTAIVYPNPFTRLLSLGFTTGHAAPIDITIVDTRGSVVARRTLAVRPAGGQQIDLDLSMLEPGAYFYRIDAGGEIYRGGVVRRE